MAGDAGRIEVDEPLHDERVRLGLYRSRSQPTGLYLLGEITNGVYAQGTRVVLPYPGAVDTVRDAWIVGRPAPSFDADAWQTITVEPYLLSMMQRGAEWAFEVHAESGLGFRKAIYPVDDSQAAGLGADRHARILLASALHHAVQNDAAPSTSDFASLCDLVLAGPSEDLTRRLDAMTDVRFMLCHAYGLPTDGGAFVGDWFDVASVPQGLDVTSAEYGKRSPWARDEVVMSPDGSYFVAAINIHERTPPNQDETGMFVWGDEVDGRRAITGCGGNLLAACRTRPFAHWVGESTFVVRVAVRDGRGPLLAVDMDRGFATLHRSDREATRPDEVVLVDLDGAEWFEDLASLESIARNGGGESPRGVRRLLAELRDVARGLESLGARRPRSAATDTGRSRRAVNEEIGLDRDFEKLEPSLTAIGAEAVIVWRDPRGPAGFVTREYAWRDRLIRIDHTFEGSFAVKVSAKPATSADPPPPADWFALETVVEPDVAPPGPGDSAEETDATTFLRRIALLPDATFPSEPPPDGWSGVQP